MDSNFNFTVSSLRQKLIVGPVTIPYFTMHPRRGRKPSFAVHDPTVLNALAILSLVEHELCSCIRRATNRPRMKISSLVTNRYWNARDFLSRVCKISTNRRMSFVRRANLNSMFGGLASWELSISIIAL